MPEFSPEARAAAQAIFSGADKDHQPCIDCGGVHARVCPRIHRLTYSLDGSGVVTHREVEYWAPGTWEDGIIWSEDVYDSDDASSGD
jgi:hypothetical protein